MIKNLPALSIKNFEDLPRFGFLLFLFAVLLLGLNGRAEAATVIKRPPNNLNLVGYWPFDGKDVTTTITNDVSGNGNHGTIVGDTKPALGKIGQAMEFDGSGDYVYLTASSNFIPSENNSITLTVWVKANSISANPISNRIINIHRGSIAGSSLALSLGSGNKVQFYNHSGLSTNSWVNTVSVGNWYFIALTYDGTSFQKYFNGNIDGSTITESLLAGGSYPAYIGSYDGNGAFINGSIDDVRIYNRALSEQEVKDLYNSTKGGKVNVTNTGAGTTLADGLVGHWTFDGKDVTTTITSDVSGNGNHGTIVGDTKPALGKIGQAMEFDGSGDHILRSPLSEDSTLDLVGSSNSNPFTISVWLKPNSSYGGIVSGVTSSGYRPYRFSIISGRPSLSLGDSTNGVVVYGDTSNGAISNGVWSHVVVVNHGGYSSSSYSDYYGIIDFYINGVVDNGGLFNNEGYGLHGFNIGSYYTARYFNGSIDDVRIYNRALSEQEVKDLYSMGR